MKHLNINNALSVKAIDKNTRRRDIASRMALIGACFLFLSSSFSPANASPITTEKSSNIDSIAVDEVWVGTGIQYQGISVGPIVYLAYFNASRELTVSRIDTKTGQVRKKTLGNTFNGWDAHNYITLNYDKNGFLHVSGNMHSSPLVYARTMLPNDFDSLVLTNKMVGADETAVTYPLFMTLSDGSLGFSFRSGSSGNGDEFINKFENGRWVRILSKPLFAPDPSGETVNAYHTSYIPRPDGYYHVAWVWRKKGGANFNFNVNYARSKDLKHWEDSHGNQIKLPITPSRSGLVDAIPVKSGLLNNIKLGFDLKGAPIISYLKYDKDGNTQLYHARLEGDTWRIVQATDWKYRWVFDYGGTLVNKITFSGVRAEQGKLYEDVYHIENSTRKFVYDPATMEKIDDQSPPKKVSSATEDVPASPLKPMRYEIHPVNKDSFKGYIKWNSLGVDNRDKPRTCESIHLKEGCSMTSTLYLVGTSKGKSPGAAQR